MYVQAVKENLTERTIIGVVERHIKRMLALNFNNKKCRPGVELSYWRVQYWFSQTHPSRLWLQSSW